jgi:apolipoprotein N-acyltransferase
MVVFRAIENGMSVVRQTDFGLSVAVDPYGWILAQMNHFTTRDRTLVAQVPAVHVVTVYAAGGHLFGWLTIIAFGVIAVVGSRSRPRKPQGQ